jgi:hypothetical protein
VVLFRGIYGQAWIKARAKRPSHRSLSDEFLWHDVFDFYAETTPRLSPEAELELVRLWQGDGDEHARASLIEAFYGIVRPIAGQIATKRFPPGLWPSQKIERNIAKNAYDGQRDRIHELASVGIFGLFVAADRFKAQSGCKFSTYADEWVRKYILLYCEEIVSVVPRTGDKGDIGRVSVMDRIDAALVGERLTRGNAAGGMAVFDAGLQINGIETEDGTKLPDFDYLSTEGPTREYLQRRVGNGGARFPWQDVGAAHDDKTFAFLRHADGKIRVAAIVDTPTDGARLHMPISREVMTPWDKPNPADDVEFTRGKRDAMPVSPFVSCWRYTEIDGKTYRHWFEHEVCYFASQRSDRKYNSWEQFEPAKPQYFSELPRSPARDQTKHWDAEFAQHMKEQDRLFGNGGASERN